MSRGVCEMMGFYSPPHSKYLREPINAWSLLLRHCCHLLAEILPNELYRPCCATHHNAECLRMNADRIAARDVTNDTY